MTGPGITKAKPRAMYADDKCPFCEGTGWVQHVPQVGEALWPPTYDACPCTNPHRNERAGGDR